MVTLSILFSVHGLTALKNFFKIDSNVNKSLITDANNSITYFIKVHKDPLPIFDSMDVIYKLNYIDCDTSYVGQTNRQLRTRINGHRCHIKRNTNTQSVITNHRLNFDHDFNWDDVKILDQEPFLNKRLISEMLFIKRQNNSLNLQTDTERLPEIYLDIVNNLPKI